ncbi:MAG: glycerol-3-phosphate 1-O-acyltransferase PlsY [Bacillota bacterium]
MKIALLIFFSYIIGSIPTAYLLTKKLSGRDLREYGSGNVGATNAARLLGVKMGFLVAVVDILKGFFTILIAQLILTQGTSIIYIFIIGIAVILGHNFSIFLNFSGGKGVATTLGVVMKILPLSFLIFIIVWILITIITRYVSLASIFAAISLIISSYFLKENIYYFYYMIIMTSSIILTHRENLKRLINGEENRMKWPPNKNRGDKNAKK